MRWWSTFLVLISAMTRDVLVIPDSDYQKSGDVWVNLLNARRKAREVFDTYEPRPDKVQVGGYIFDQTLTVPNVGKVFREWERQVLG